MNHYSMTVQWSEEDEAFIARSPEWSGLSGFGDTREEALKEAGIALEGFIDVALAHAIDLPEPRQMVVSRS